MCIRLWMLSVDLCEKRFKQTSHSNGRSPVWVLEMKKKNNIKIQQFFSIVPSIFESKLLYLRWISRYGFLQNAAGHKSQRNGRFPTAPLLHNIYMWMNETWNDQKREHMIHDDIFFCFEMMLCCQIKWIDDTSASTIYSDRQIVASKQRIKKGEWIRLLKRFQI